MADAVAPGMPKKRQFHKFCFRGIEMESLLKMKDEDLLLHLKCRQRRKFARGIGRKPITLLKKLRKAKKECVFGEKPVPVKTHLRNMTVMPDMIGAVAAVYNGKEFVSVEVKPEMIGHYLGEFAITYKPQRHGRAGQMGTKMIPTK